MLIKQFVFLNVIFYLPGCQDLLNYNSAYKCDILVLSQFEKGKFNKTVLGVVAAGHRGLHTRTSAAQGHFTSTFGP